MEKRDIRRRRRNQHDEVRLVVLVVNLVAVRVIRGKGWVHGWRRRHASSTRGTARRRQRFYGRLRVGALESLLDCGSERKRAVGRATHGIDLRTLPRHHLGR
jgi:hypothetical protein